MKKGQVRVKTPFVTFIAATEEIASIVHDALRFAREDFRDENGLPFSNEETAALQEVIDALEKAVEP